MDKTYPFMEMFPCIKNSIIRETFTLLMEYNKYPINLIFVT